MANRNAQDRYWYVPADPMEVDDEATLGMALGEIITILTRVGGGAMVAAHRKEVAPGNWMTVGYHIKWQSFIPGERFEQPEPQADELETAAA